MTPPDTTTPAPRRPMMGLALVGAAVAGAIAVRLISPQPAAAIAPESATLVADGKGVLLTADAPQRKYVQFSTAAKQPALAPLPAPARVDMDESRTATISAPLAGRVEQVQVRLGDVVHRGDRLFSVRSGAFSDLDRDVASGQEGVAVKKRLHDRAKELSDLKAVPEKEELALAAELKDAELTLHAAQARRQSLAVVPGADNLFWVLAPRDGAVVDSDLFAGQTVAPDRERPLLRLSSLDQVMVVADLQEADAADVRPGMPVQILLQAGQGSVPGIVQHVSQIVDPHRRTVALRVRAANPKGLLRPNAFVQVVVPPPAGTDFVRVPAEAVVSEGNDAVMFVEAGSGRLQRVSVVPGRQRDGEVEIASGLDVGARYVSKGALLLLNEIDLVN